MSEITDAVERLVSQHGGLNKAARAIGIDAPHLCRIRTGKLVNLSAKTLAKLGLKRKIYIVPR